MNNSTIFVRHALGVTDSVVPDIAIEAAKTFILDTVGVGVAGCRAPYANEVLSVAKTFGTGEAASVFGRKAALPTASAAFVNGFQIHCQEFDCVHEPAVVHPMATIFSALLADAEARGGITGRKFITAIVVAVDIAASLGVAVTSGIRFFRPATAGMLAATLGISRLREFDEETALNALGYALAFVSGTMQAHVEGKPALPIQIGNAARGAVVACDIAQAGIPGPHDVIDGPFGYLNLFELESDISSITASFGKTWRICDVSHKPFPTGRAAHGGIVAIQRLRELGLRSENLEQLSLYAPPLIHRLVGRPYKKNMTANYARLCFQYCGAMALRQGSVGLDDFMDFALGDAETSSIAQCIEVVDNGMSDPAAFTPQKAIAHLNDGRVLEVVINHLYGSKDEPLGNERHLEKFHECIAFGNPKTGKQQAYAIVQFVDNLGTQSEMRVLARLASGLME